MSLRSISLLSSLVLLVAVTGISLSAPHGDSDADIQAKLTEWQKGVWISGTGTYTIYTDHHYFVVSFEGDTLSPNIYVGASQLAFHNRGMARKQNLRLRQLPGGEMSSFVEHVFQGDHSEEPMLIDSTLFKPGVCNIKDGIIYDAVTEAGEDFILLATCNDDRIKLFSNGVSVYLPASGGAYYSYRVEKL